MKKYFSIFYILFLSLTMYGEFKPIKEFPISPYSGDIAVHNGKIYQVDILKDSIFIYDLRTGERKGRITTAGFSPYSLCFCNDTLVVSNNDEIRFISYKGKIYRAIYSPTSSITGIAFDGKNIWVTGRDGKIYCISRNDGTTIKTLNGPGWRNNGLSFYKGYLWTTNRYRNEIYMICVRNGEVINVLPSPGPYPSGIEVIDNKIYVSDFEMDSVYLFDIPYKDYIIKGKPEKARVTLYFRLINDGPGSINNVDVFIALPENRENQLLLSKPAFEPSPSKIVVDQYNQKVAHYKFQNVKKGEKRTASVKVDAELRSVSYFIVPERVGNLNDIPKEIKKRYLQDKDRYMIKDPFIKNSVKRAIGRERNSYWIAKDIFNYVINHMEYELSGGWDIAPEVLKRGKGSCSEYSYVFISMMRAAGIPTRYIGSVVERGDRASIDGVFHRWTEIYLPGYGWIPVDPSGGDSHIPRNRALAFGHRSNGYLITTIGGGDSRYLDWSYNFNVRVRGYDSNANFHIDRMAIWEPIK